MLVLALAVLADPGLLALQAADARVATVAHRLQVANVVLCREVGALPGFSMHTLVQYARDERAGAKATFGLDARPAVLAVATGSAAAMAGLRANDVVTAIDGTPVVQSSDGAGHRDLDRAQALLDAGLADGAVTLDVVRGGINHRIAFTAERGCASRVELVPGPSLNASADGHSVQIGGRMVAFAATDDALAVIVAHELAHNILGHRARLDAQRVRRGLFAGLGANGAKLRTTELEADRLSVALVANAGYRLDAIMPFWNALRTRTDYGFLASGAHPAWPARLTALEAAVAEQTTSQALNRR